MSGKEKKQVGETEREDEKKAPHTEHKRMKIFFLKTIQADGQKQEHSNSTYRDIQRNSNFHRKCAALI